MTSRSVKRPQRGLPGWRQDAEQRPHRVLMVDDGTPGGIRRSVEYLVAEWRTSDGTPEVDRIALRGAGSLAAAVPVFLSSVAWTAVRMVWRRPSVVHINVTQRGSTARAFAIVALARAGGVPTIIHLHSSKYRAFVDTAPAPAVALIRWMFNAASRVLVLGDGWADYVHTTLRVPLDHLLVVPNAVPGPDDAELQWHNGKPQLLFLGQLGRRKGVPDLIEALGRPQVAALPWQAVLAGDGDPTPYREQARQLQIEDRIHFCGWIETAEVRRQLLQADVLVLPSHAEGLPLAVLEGLAYRLAVVATPVGAVAEVIRNGETGLLTPPGDVDALAAALSAVLADRAQRERLAANGREAWEAAHDITVYAKRMTALYDEVARGGR